ncbi:MarR family winged helix-turn-helix transcriptional regulator [Cupriavidus numazuensis]|nr:MarR family transcriptional regulator [Cupriavidus numazuensis]
MKQDNPIFDLPSIAKAGMRQLHPDDGALLLMHFAFRGLVVKADELLATYGLTRVHHRILYAIARSERLSVGGLVELLGVSKQALHRPLKHLQEAGYVIARRDEIEHRVKILSLTSQGAEIELLASRQEAAAMQAALANVSAAEQKAWRKIMITLARMV